MREGGDEETGVEASPKDVTGIPNEMIKEVEEVLKRETGKGSA